MANTPPPNAAPGAPWGPPPGSPVGPGAPKKKGSTCLVIALICLGCLVLFGGVFVVLGIYGARKYIANAKMAEARNSVAQIGRDAVAAYEGGYALPTGKSGRALCGSVSRPVPSNIAAVTGKKYQSSESDWQVDAPRHAGFACLHFMMTQPQYYMYSYKAHGSSAAGDGFEATAQGDLDADGKASLFKLEGSVDSSGALNVAPTLIEQNPED
jgi:type IV pilus assembly protein PilA